MSKLLVPISFLISLNLGASATAQTSQFGGLPPELAIPIQEMRFDTPTRIEGRVLYLDSYDDALWIGWLKVFENGSWHAVPDGREFIVYPRDAAMMTSLKAFPKGTVIRLIVQRGEDGKLRALSFDDL